MKNLNLMLFVFLRRLIYLFLSSIDQRLGRDNRLVVLCYHGISDEDWRFSVSPEEFKRQIKYMLSHYQPITLNDLYSYLSKGKKIEKPSFILTFDDGYKNIIKTRQFLSDRHITPAVFVLGSPQKINWKSIGRKIHLLSNKDIKSLQKSGWEIGFHGMSHTSLTELNEGQLKKEITSQYKYFAFAKGKYPKKIAYILKKVGYKMALTMDDGIISINTNLFTIPRIGVDRTHNFSEFKAIVQPSVVRFRSLIKQSFLGHLI